MRKQFLFFYFLFITTLGLYAQDREKYDWEAERKRSLVGVEDEKSPAVTLKDKRMVEYMFTGDRQLVCYKTVHKIILVNTDEAIEMFNKVYIQVENENSLIDIKARSINKSGKITSFDKKNLKEIKSGEQLAFFKIFAIEGLEPGSEVEYIYTVKKSLNFFGRESLQNGFPTRNLTMDIVSPAHLVFEARGYNGLADFKDTVLEEKRFLTLYVDTIPAAVEEEYAVYEGNLKRVDYKLSYNKNTPGERLFSWDEVSQRVVEQFSVFTSGESSKVKKLVKSQKFAKIADEEGKIRAIENYVKSNYIIRQGADDKSLEDVITNKYASEQGMVRLFEALLSEMNINHEIVYTSDRSVAKFDGEFDSWNFLENTVFYFPSSKKYLAPTVMEMRYGMIPFYWTNNEGLFIKKIVEGKTVKSQSEIKFIPALKGDNSMDNIYADIAISPDMDNVDIHVKRKIGGYNAVMFQPVYNRLDESQKSELNDNLLQFISKDSEIKNVKVENTSPDQSLVDFPFIIEADIKLNSLIEKAGNKYIFKVGDVIGRQSELYSEKKRVNDVENDFNRIYMREIKVKLPEGYSVKNPDDIKINVAYDVKGEKAMGFISDYKLEGDMLTISINEYYNRIDFPLEMYEDFRKVINAAADFNKVTLIFEKKN